MDELAGLIDWVPIERHLAVISCAAKGEPAWPPLALFKAMLLSIWYDLSDVITYFSNVRFRRKPASERLLAIPWRLVPRVCGGPVLPLP